MNIKVYYPEGSARYTDCVELATAATHIAARDHLAEEAKLLLAAEYDYDGWPAQVDGWKIVADEDEYVEYERT